MPGYEFLLTDPDAVPNAWAALGPRYTAVAGTRRRQTRVWLDTFDGRLAAAGLTLAQVTAADSPELVLTGRDGAALRQPAVLRWPALVEALPPGPIAERLRSVVSVRALLPLARVRSEVAEWRLLNRDDKIVVRAYLDQASTTDARLPYRLLLVPVRGYDDQAARIARLLTGVPGVDPHAPAELDLLRSAGATAAAPVPVATSLRPGQPVTAGLAGLLLGWWDAIERNVPGVLADLDTEFLHDLRVAVRRTRSVLKLAGDRLPAGVAGRFGAEFKWLGDATTPLRDLDVLLLDFPDMVAALTEAPADDLAPLREYLRARRAAERRRILRELRSARFAELAEQWRAALTPLTRGRRRTVDAEELATQRIGQAWRRVDRRTRTLTGDAADKRPPSAAPTSYAAPELLHDIRKRCKELRYLLELFAEVCRPEPHRALVKELKGVQDWLGWFQDAEVHRDAVRGYAVAMLADHLATAPTLLAMGELVACYGARQRRAAAEAIVRVRDLVGAPNRRKVAALVAPA